MSIGSRLGYGLPLNGNSSLLEVERLSSVHMVLVERYENGNWQPAVDLIDERSRYCNMLGYYGEVELCWWKNGRGATSLLQNLNMKFFIIELL